jgi:hypothetical protein
MGTALALMAALSAGQTALADTQVGVVGDHPFTDDSTHRGATCKYTQDSKDPNLFWISSITAVAPKVWWPDRNSSITNEHGIVGWRIAVQKSSNGSTWTNVAQSSYQKKTAYEDQLKAYDPIKKAPFTNMTVSFNGKSYGMIWLWRVVVRPIWYKPGGAVLGYIKHPVQWYVMKVDTIKLTGDNPYCGATIQRV